jgi:hypothetical protein
MPMELPGVSPLENFVAVTLLLDELLRIVGAPERTRMVVTRLY